MNDNLTGRTAGAAEGLSSGTDGAKAPSGYKVVRPRQEKKELLPHSPWTVPSTTLYKMSPGTEELWMSGLSSYGYSLV